MSKKVQDNPTGDEEYSRFVTVTWETIVEGMERQIGKEELYIIKGIKFYEEPE